MAAHDLAFGVGQRLSEVRARREEAQDEGGHAPDSTPHLQPDRPDRRGQPEAAYASQHRGAGSAAWVVSGRVA
jgi:hypothetical protein